MAVQTRRGAYENFDPNKLLAGEWATVLSGDPNASDGRAAYLCFDPGEVKRMATYEDMVDNVEQAAGDVANMAAEKATEAANSLILDAAEGANKAAQNAQSVADTVQSKLDSGDFIGPQGPQGPPGSVENISQQAITFTKADLVADIASGSTLTVLFGQILKNQMDFLNSETIDAAENAGIIGGTGITLLNSILQETLINPIVEETVVDAWVVRKYANGKAEAIFNYTTPLAAISQQSGSLYKSVNINRKMPTGVFKNVYRIEPQMVFNGSGVSGIGIRRYSPTDFDWYVWTSTAWDSGVSIIAIFKVEGTWK